MQPRLGTVAFMRIHPNLRHASLLGLLPLICLALRTANAGSATWNLNPVSSDWNGEPIIPATMGMILH